MVNPEEQLSLTIRIVRGGGWIVGWRVATRILGTVSTLLLVRLLTPSDFGLVALGTAFSQALDGLSEIGVRRALVREDRVDRALYDTAFTLMVIRGSTSALLIIGCAWPVASFFGEPRLVSILLALSVAMLISALENIGVADFQRDLAFEKEFGLYLAPRIFGVIACLATAYVWQSYWALVVGILTTRSTETLCTYLMHSYRPRLSLRAWRQIVEFSFWSWMLSWVSLIRDRIDSFVIGRLLGTTQVGLYSVAFDVGFLTTTELVGPICRVLFSGLVQVKSRGKDVADVYFRAISATLVITLPAGIGLALVADPLVRLAVGSRWLAAVPLVQIFAVIGTFGVVTHISKTLLTVYGMMQVQFVSTAIILLIRLALLIVLISQFGLVGAGFAVAVVAVLEEFFYLTVTFRLFNLRPADLLTVNWRSLIATAAMAGAVLLMKDLLVRAPDPTFGHFFAQVMGGVVTYVTVLVAAWLAAGRPSGAEAQIIAVVREAAGLIRRNWLPAR